MLQETAIRRRYKTARENLWKPKPPPQIVEIIEDRPGVQEVPVSKPQRPSFASLEHEIAFLRKERGRLLRELASLRQRLDRKSDFKNPVHMRTIKAACSAAFNVPVRELESESQRQAVCRARDAAVWLGQRLSKLSTSAIGEHLGDRDHSTIVVAIQRGEEKMIADEGYRATITAIYRELAKAAGVENVEQ